MCYSNYSLNIIHSCIYIILEVHKKLIIQKLFSLSITKQLQMYTHGNRNILCDAQQVQ